MVVLALANGTFAAAGQKTFPGCVGGTLVPKLLTIADSNIDVLKPLKKLLPEGDCVRDKAKKELSTPSKKRRRTWSKAIKGKCPTCGKRVLLKFGRQRPHPRLRLMTSRHSRAGQSDALPPTNTDVSKLAYLNNHSPTPCTNPATAGILQPGVNQHLGRRRRSNFAAPRMFVPATELGSNILQAIVSTKMILKKVAIQDLLPKLYPAKPCA